MLKKTLYKLAGKSDEQRFAALYHEFFDAVYKFVYWRVSDAELAEDITGEVFTKAWQNFHTFTADYPKAWLFTIARNLVIDSYRRKKPTAELDEEIEGDYNQADVTDAILSKEKIHRALARLPEESRQIVECRYMLGMSVREVAELLSLTEANIRVKQHRAIKDLRKLYEK